MTNARNARLMNFRPMALSAFFLAGAAYASAQRSTPIADAAVTSTPAVLIATAEPTVPVFATTGTGTAGVSNSLGDSATMSDAAVPANALPDAPSTTELRAASPALDMGFSPANQATPNVAPKYTKYIPAGMQGQSINAHDKVLIGFKDLYSPLNFVAMIASAGYEQVTNGSPNYGTDRGAFGQRLGAAAIRESTQGIFTDAVFSPIYHTDPRYYVKGQGHSFINRTVYSVTRVLVTRTDGGHSTINGALLTGYAASAALGYTYYPAINQNFRDTASAFGGSLGGAALGFFVSEFADDAARMVHLKK
jgi:hypothetical protein